MHVHLKVRRWVLWWVCVGIVCGAVALVNIFARDLSATQVKFVLAIGALHWVLGGIVCYGYGGIRFGMPAHHAEHPHAEVPPQQEWHFASEFLLPGNRKSLLPPRYLSFHHHH